MSAYRCSANLKDPFAAIVRLTQGGGYRPLGDGTILLDLLFMSYPEVRVGLKRLGLTSPHID